VLVTASWCRLCCVCFAQMKASHVFVMALAIFAVAYAQEDEEEFDEIEVEEDIHAGSAHCVLHKEIVAENDMVVADKSFTVAYTVFNIGNAPCVDVSVRESIPNADFAIEEGSAEQFWETILPYVKRVSRHALLLRVVVQPWCSRRWLIFVLLCREHKESFNVTMKPTKAGVWSPARATVEYRDEGLGEDKVCSLRGCFLRCVLRSPLILVPGSVVCCCRLLCHLPSAPSKS